MSDLPEIVLPKELIPSDGRFGCGPSKVRLQTLDNLCNTKDSILGTSHRQPTVKDLVSSIRGGLTELFCLPEGYEVVLGNGGATAFWDIATFCLIDKKSQHLEFGEFSSKFAKASKDAPHLLDPEVIKSEPGTHPLPHANPDIDLYAFTHNETSTGVSMEIVKPEGISDKALVAVDATSGAGGLRVNSDQFDVYYFAPQKCFGSDGGLWIALMSPKAVERTMQIVESERFVPAFFDLKVAIENSRLNQTYNTPALTTLFMLNDQVNWMLSNGGMDFTVGRCDTSATTIYSWAENSDFSQPFVANPAERSHVVATIDFNEEIDAMAIAKILRKNGIVDTEPYRKLGRNQLRIAMFPSIDPDDISTLCNAIDYIVQKIN
jgi:phosphoserine aminotransferase